MNPLDPTVLERLLLGVWETLFVLGEKPQAQEEAGGGASVSAWLRLMGPREHWLVWIDCDERLVRRTAALVFGGEPEAATWYQMTETLAEMTNIVGGNLKGLATQFNGMSVPSTGQRPGKGPDAPGAETLAKVGVRYRGGRIELNVLRLDAAA